MNWTTAKLASESIALLTVAACAVFTTAKLNTVMYNLDGAIARLEGVESKANATLVNLDAYTKTWAAASKDQTTAIQELATDAHGTLSQADNALASIPPISASMVDELAALKGTTTAATGTLQAVTTDVQALKPGLDAFQPLLSQYTQDGADLDALLKDKAVYGTLDNVQSLTGSAAHITNDAQRVADDATAKYFKPIPWYRAALPYLTTGAKIAAYALPW